MSQHLRPLSLVEIEDRIRDVIERMEKATEEYDDISRIAADAEADYRYQAGLTLLAVIAHGEKMTVSEREARVAVSTADFYKQHLTTLAARNSAREHLQTLRAHLDSLRTLNASVRGQA